MREFKTRREAEEEIEALERTARMHYGNAQEMEHRAAAVRGAGAQDMAEADRIRALLPTLPEDDNAAR